jgi:hypothetical protein
MCARSLSAHATYHIALHAYIHAKDSRGKASYDRLLTALASANEAPILNNTQEPLHPSTAPPSSNQTLSRGNHRSSGVIIEAQG